MCSGPRAWPRKKQKRGWEASRANKGQGRASLKRGALVCVLFFVLFCWQGGSGVAVWRVVVVRVWWGDLGDLWGERGRVAWWWVGGVGQWWWWWLCRSDGSLCVRVRVPTEKDGGRHKNEAREGGQERDRRPGGPRKRAGRCFSRPPPLVSRGRRSIRGRKGEGDKREKRRDSRESRFAEARSRVESCSNPFFAWPPSPSSLSSSSSSDQPRIMYMNRIHCDW